MPKAWPLFLVFTLAGCTQSFSQGNLLNLFAVPQTPKSWDHRIGQVVSGSVSQVVSQDLWGSTPETITSLKKAGKAVLCYSPTDQRTREQVARSLKLNVSGSKHDNGGSPDANANPTTCAFGAC